MRELNLNLKANAVYAPSGRLPLQTNEFALLRVFALHPDRVLSKDALIESLESYENFTSENALAQTVTRLRKQLAPHGVHVRVARGIGYFLEVDKP